MKLGFTTFDFLRPLNPITTLARRDGFWKMQWLRSVSIAAIVSGAIVSGAIGLACGQTQAATKELPSINERLMSFRYTEEELEKTVPPANPDDVGSPQAIARALHEAVSGPKGDWNPDRLRSLCIPNVFFESNEADKNGTFRLAQISLDDLIKEVKRIHRDDGWYENVGNISVTEIHRDGGVKLAIVTYSGGEGFHPNNPVPEHPTASTFLMNTGKRWWVVSHIW